MPFFRFLSRSLVPPLHCQKHKRVLRSCTNVRFIGMLCVSGNCTVGDWSWFVAASGWGLKEVQHWEDSWFPPVCISSKACRQQQIQKEQERWALFWASEKVTQIYVLWKPPKCNDVQIKGEMLHFCIECAQSWLKKTKQNKKPLCLEFRNLLGRIAAMCFIFSST